jgi:hypothetical protein
MTDLRLALHAALRHRAADAADRQQLAAVCVHEASHVLVASHVKFPWRLVSITPHDDCASGQVWFGADWSAKSSEVAALTVFLAGGVGENVYLGREPRRDLPPSAASDLELARCVEQISKSATIADDAYTLAESLVIAHWDDVGRVAVALAHAGELDDLDVQHLLQKGKTR